MKHFLVSVANAVGRDPATGEGLFYGTTNASTSVNLSMSEEEIRGGINNVIQGVYYHDKTLECTIEKPTFARSFLPLNVGTDILQAQNVKVLQTECLTLGADGSGGVSKPPVGFVNVFLDEDTVMTVTAESSTGADGRYGITVPSMAGQMVTAIYDAYEQVDVLTVETATPPKVVDLTLLIQVRDENMNLAYVLQYNIPKFQVSGNYELSLSADGVSSESLSGKALNVKGESCATGDMYATIKWVPAAEAAASVSGIIITNGDINATAGQAAEYSLNVIGMRGSLDNRINVTDSCEYALNPASPTGVTLVNNVITLTDAATATGANPITVTATYNNYSDTIRLIIAPSE